MSQPTGATVRELRVRLDQHEVRVLTSGEQGPCIVLLAGLSDDAWSWEPQLRSLGGRFRVLSIENRGVGTTRAPAGPISAALMARDAAEVLGELGVRRAHVVGNSLGGAIAQELALLAPDAVASLALVGTWARADDLFRMVVENWRDTVGRVDTRTFLAGVFSWCFAPATYAGGLVAGWVEESAAHAQSPADFRRQCAAVLDFDSTTRLGALSRPTAVVVGAQDGLVGARHTEPLAALLPGCMSITLPGVGHTPHVEDPAGFEAALDGLWAAAGDRR